MKYEFLYGHIVEEEIEGAPLEAAIEASRAGRGNQLSKKQGELWSSQSSWLFTIVRQYQSVV